MNMKPRRGEVWWVDLSPVRGHEQDGARPCLVISDNLLNHGTMELAVIIPATSRPKSWPLHVEVKAPVAGLKQDSWFMPQHIQSASLERFAGKLGDFPLNTFDEVMDKLLHVLGL